LTKKATRKFPVKIGVPNHLPRQKAKLMPNSFSIAAIAVLKQSGSAASMPTINFTGLGFVSFHICVVNQYA